MNKHMGSPSCARPQVRKSFDTLARDALELGELQVKLFKLDSAEAVGKMRTAAVFSAIGLALLLASLPVGLLAVAESLVEYGQWTRASALAGTAVAALVLCPLVALAAWWSLKQGLSAWQRSGEELHRNLTWLKSKLQGDAPMPSPRGTGNGVPAESMTRST